MLSRKKISLALSSGSAKGLAHIGVINYLQEIGFKFDAIAGSSIGAVIGAYLAFGKLKNYETFVRNLTKIKTFSLFSFNFNINKGLLDGDKICKFLLENLGDYNIEDAFIPLYIVTTDLETGKQIVFKKGKVINAIRASISIPGIFTPYRYKGYYLVDGAVSNPLPIEVLIKNGFKKICAVDLNNKIREFSYKKTPNFISTIYRSSTIMNYYQTKYILSKYKPKYLISPNLNEIGMFDYHLASEIIEIGYNEAKKVLEGQ